MGEEALQSFKVKRGTIKSACTRFNTYLNSIDLDAPDLVNLSLRKKTFEPLLNNYNEIQSSIEAIDLDADHESERTAFEDLYYEYLARAEKLLGAHRSTFRSAGSISHTSDNFNQIRLPKIDLPSFSGAYDQWHNFHGTFKSMIHENEAISDIQKFHYLKSAVKGSAADIIASFEMTAEYYHTAWKLLEDRFDCKRLIIQSHIQQIFDLPVSTKENHIMLRKIVDGAQKHLRALTALQRPTESWDDLIIHIVITKIDSSTKKEWESTLDRTSVPTWQQMLEFLSKKCHTLESVASSSVYTKQNVKYSVESKQHEKPFKSTFSATSTISCVLCNKQHHLYACNDFLGQNTEQRIVTARAHNICLNCLRYSTHQAANCSAGSCKTCNKKHNTLLHLSGSTRTEKNYVSKTKPSAEPKASSSTSGIVSLTTNSITTHVFLSTALIDVQDTRGGFVQCRALLDNGSQSNFITQSMAQRLGLKQKPTNISIGGIGESENSINKYAQIKFKSNHTSYSTQLNCLIITKIAKKHPEISVPVAGIKIPRNITLADPEFNVRGEIDMLIGGEIFWDLICVGQIKPSKSDPIFQKTKLGWIVGGHTNQNFQSLTKPCNLFTQELNRNMERFWTIESVAGKKTHTKEEQLCENHFQETYHRNEEGRFIVELPVKPPGIPGLGNSYNTAVKRFTSLERKLNRNPELKKQYQDFINEYQQLGHMKLAENPMPDNGFYLPHHCVLKEASTTTKLRVVFDGSAQSSTGIALNDILMVGPTLQEDLVSIIMRFRIHRYVMTADIAKMYRQVLVDDTFQELQKILWRQEDSKQVQTYKLTTVTYGTASASYLAIKSLRQLAEIEKNNFPKGSEVALRDFYVDDLLTGASSKQEMLCIQEELCNFLPKGGFHLRKWASNCEEVLNNINDTRNENEILTLDKTSMINTLGLQWHPGTDMLQYSVQREESLRKITKRTILSRTAKIFDPLGLLGPVIITAKILMQSLWQLNLHWDESVPMQIQSNWIQFEVQLDFINKIQIPRLVVCEQPATIQIHGFCDASETAYGACVYIRSTNADNVHTSALLSSKSRVAPLHNISLPRLELSGALLLAQLCDKILSTLRLAVTQVHYWTDSTIVLAWLRSTSRTWKTFVANRVSEIQETTNTRDWHHVASAENPADIISRGMTCEELLKSNLWWHGPDWLSKDVVEWPISRDATPDHEIPERRTVTTAVINKTVDTNMFEKFSSSTKLIRVIAYCVRFLYNCKQSRDGQPDQRNISYLTSTELQEAQLRIVKLVQETAYHQDIHDLRNNRSLQTTSKILSLRPYLDDHDILRVGGRLERAHQVHIDRKHPMLLPANHRFTKLIIQEEHRRQLHAGALGTLASLRSKFWIPAGRSTVRQVIRTCIKCFRAKPTISVQQMGNLHPDRIQPSRPFTNTGVDYFGPLYVREGKRRNSKAVKTYGVVFICLATKCVHLEVVSDLSAEAFINTLKRFMSRRGKVSKLHSDNATNFIGANNELKKMKEVFLSETNKYQVHSFLNGEGIQWQFTPPRAPNFGGLWEAAVKSAKYHMKRIIGNSALTFEEMSTILAQIEAVLNSRPLTPLSNDVNDYSFLTPAHFLINDSLISIPEPSLSDLSVNRLSRWQHLQAMQQHFWRRWSKEYLGHLQERTKWKANRGQQLEPGTLVIMRDDNSPPLHWPMGRIEATHPGIDGIVRVATVRTARGTFKRPASKLSPLPIET